MCNRTKRKRDLTIDGDVEKNPGPTVSKIIAMELRINQQEAINKKVLDKNIRKSIKCWNQDKWIKESEVKIHSIKISSRKETLVIIVRGKARSINELEKAVKCSDQPYYVKQAVARKISKIVDKKEADVDYMM
eukprot:Lithocolla_globosa_v1_NODE_4645_length_1395_cov_4.241045.p2 type:complete len:133 gc:universal NODE_4645_length_1395_cov_4.241045:587-189(-)